MSFKFRRAYGAGVFGGLVLCTLACAPSPGALQKELDAFASEKKICLPIVTGFGADGVSERDDPSAGSFQDFIDVGVIKTTRLGRSKQGVNFIKNYHNRYELVESPLSLYEFYREEDSVGRRGNEQTYTFGLCTGTLRLKLLEEESKVGAFSVAVQVEGHWEDLPPWHKEIKSTIYPPHAPLLAGASSPRTRTVHFSYRPFAGWAPVDLGEFKR